MLSYLNDKDIEVGVDEVGRGCLFGPVVAALCIFPKEIFDDIEVPIIRDSKKCQKNKEKLRIIKCFFLFYNHMCQFYNMIFLEIFQYFYYFF